MEICHNHYCGIQALLVLWILFFIPFTSKGDTDAKKCSYPNIIGCFPCSQDNLMQPFFGTHISLSDLKFSNYLYKKISSSDFSCKGMTDNIEIFELSSIMRHLIGEGSHRELVTTMIFGHHPKFIHIVSEQICEAIIIEFLPNAVFLDPFQLQHLVRREAFLSASVFGDTNLELPSALSNSSAVELHIAIRSGNQEIVTQLPLHSRYPLLDSTGYADITIGEPDLFLRCRPKNPQTEDCMWTLIDLGVSSAASNVSWRIPCGNELHAEPVTVITFLSALFFSLLIVFSSICFSKKNQIKVE